MSDEIETPVIETCDHLRQVYDDQTLPCVYPWCEFSNTLVPENAALTITKNYPGGHAERLVFARTSFETAGHSIEYYWRRVE